MKGFVVLLLTLGWGIGAFAQPLEGQYLNLTGTPVDVSRGLVYKNVAGIALTLDAYVPREKKAGRPAVLWIHGGGFTSGNKEVGPAAEFALELARRGYVCFSMDYRLDGSIATGLEDAVSAFHWISERATLYGLDPQRIAVGGDSAGGILSVHAAYSTSAADIHPFAVLNIYGSLTPNQWSGARVPVLTLHGDRDQTIPIGATYALERRLEAKKIPHRFFLMKNEGHNVLGRYRDDAVLEILSFLYTYLDTKPRAVEPALEVKPGQTVLGFKVEPPGNGTSPVNFVLVRPQGGKPFVIQPLKTVVAKSEAAPLVIPRVSSAVDVDGDLGEWPKTPLFVLDRADQTMQLPEWKGPEDLSAKVWLAWDEDALYVAVEATSATFHQTKTDDAIWQEDSVQISVDTRPAHEAEEAPTEGYTELGLAWNTARRQNEFFRWIFPESQIGEPWMGTVRVVPRGKTMLYEASLPWSNLGAEAVQTGRPFQFSLLVNHLGPNNIRGWIEYGGGVGRSKDATLFVKAVLK